MTALLLSEIEQDCSSCERRKRPTCTDTKCVKEGHYYIAELLECPECSDPHGLDGAERVGLTRHNGTLYMIRVVDAELGPGNKLHNVGVPRQPFETPEPVDEFIDFI